MTGWIKLHRQFMEWEWYRDTNTKALFIHLLLNANVKDTKYMGTLVPRGSWMGKVIGRKKGGCDNLLWELNLTEGELKTAMNHLIKTGEITTKTTNKSTLITIVNYDFYQGNEEKTTINQQPNDNLTSSIEEEVKKERNTPLTPQRGKREKGPLYTEEEKEALNEVRKQYEFSKELSKAVKEWCGYKIERRDKYRPIGFRNLLSEIRNCAADYGEKAVIDTIRKSMANGYQGITFDAMAKKSGGAAITPDPYQGHKRIGDDEQV